MSTHFIISVLLLNTYTLKILIFSNSFSKLHTDSWYVNKKKKKKTKNIILIEKFKTLPYFKSVKFVNVLILPPLMDLHFPVLVLHNSYTLKLSDIKLLPNFVSITIRIGWQCVSSPTHNSREVHSVVNT